RAVLALIALIVAALTTLVVPLAIRRIIDFGFSADGIALINSYFGVMIAVVAVLALASAARYAHITTLSPAFFDLTRSGELVSRLTADTTQIKSAVGSSVSVALRNLVLFIG